MLCREVGAQHPDGALKQIRTMKRLLRSHYRVKQRLEDYGVESLEEAVLSPPSRSGWSAPSAASVSAPGVG
ncbi:MAG: hypothetical protein BRD55_07910 [Bacteroidetes bacterium SW_9_63_38]|nr:MAG: hypothetical protein BRD55_07910 [Bacteroidetes bacterium SW_9_63_38]